MACCGYENVINCSGKYSKKLGMIRKAQQMSVKL